MHTSLTQRITAIQHSITELEARYQRTPHAVNLLAVSKTQSASTIASAYQAGLRHFGENYLQEARQKQQLLGAFDITWHFIGPIQANKTKAIAQHFDWVHSVDSVKIAQRLSQQRPSTLAPLNICLQVNISAEASKSGIALDALQRTCEHIASLPKLQLRGVMAIPAPETDFNLQCYPYQRLYQATQALDKFTLDCFSFGMSGDLAAAIKEGATWVRLGTALFGAR